MSLLNFLTGEKYDFINYKSLRNTVKEVNYYIDGGMSCFVYFNAVNGKTFTIDAPLSAVSIPAFSDKHLLLLGRYNRFNHVPNVYEFADIIYCKLKDSPYASAILNKKRY